MNTDMLYANALIERIGRQAQRFMNSSRRISPEWIGGNSFSRMAGLLRLFHPKLTDCPLASSPGYATS